MVIFSVLLYRLIFVAGPPDYKLWIAYVAVILYFFWRAYRLKSRVADLVIAAANRCGPATRLRKKSKPAPEPEKKT